MISSTPSIVPCCRGGSSVRDGCMGMALEWAPGLIMGACETLNPAGVRLLIELNAPLADGRGDRLAPLALVLETYARNPQGKHETLELLAQCGYDLPDTPMMAFHRGDVSQIEKHLRRDPKLLERRFTLD
ncbi:MAG: hypothetical protein JO108_33550, partial [Acidobacteriaceae bacterium]|nr:hypothetical protein [Acidobacteriaceae bacterium]